MSHAYTVYITETAKKELAAVPLIYRWAIVKKIAALAANPYPMGVTKLHGSLKLFRIRHADYRIIYEIQGQQLIVQVVKIGHRKEVYRKVA